MDAGYQSAGRGGELDVNNSFIRVNPEKEKALEEIDREEREQNFARDDSIGTYLKTVSFDRILEEDMHLFITGSNRSYKELPGSCTGYFIMMIVVYISTGYFNEVTRPSDYYAKVMTQESFFSTGLEQVKEYVQRTSRKKKGVVNVYNDDGTIQSNLDGQSIDNPTLLYRSKLKKLSTKASLDPFNLFRGRDSEVKEDAWQKKVQEVTKPYLTLT